MYKVVRPGKRVDGSKLEKALLKAADDVGLKARSLDKYSEDYVLGSLRTERRYMGTVVSLHGKFFGVAVIDGIYKNMGNDTFNILTGVHAPGYFASQATIEKYLTAVSKYLE